MDFINTFISIYFLTGAIMFMLLGISRPQKFAAMFKKEPFGHKIMLFITGCFATPGIALVVILRHYFLGK